MKAEDRVNSDAFLSWTIIWLALSSAMLCAFWSRAGKFPIKQRWPGMVFSSMAIHLISLALLNCTEVILPSQFPVFCDLLFGYLAVPVPTFMIVTRVWKFYFDFKSSQARASTSSANSWFLQPHNRKYRNPVYLIISCVLLAILYISTAVIISEEKGFWDKSYAEVNSIKLHNYVMTVSSIILSVLFLILSLLLHGSEEDGLHIKKELRLSGFSIVALVLAFMGYTLFQTRSKFFGLVTINVASFYTVLIQVGFPVLLSMKGKKKCCFVVTRPRKKSAQTSENSRGETSDGTVTNSGQTLKLSSNRIKIDDILKDEALLAAFHEHLVKELCVENLYFLLDAQHFKKVSPEKLAAKFLLLIEKYIVEDAPFQLNLPSDMQKKLLDLYKRVKAGDTSGLGTTIFQPAEVEIGSLLDSDSVRRFRKSILRSQTIANELSEFRI
jgi:hypothetical protein